MGDLSSSNKHGFHEFLDIFRVQKKCLAELRRELVRGCTVSRYELFETSPETIEQELRPAVC